jgi:hypothetical protein
VSEIEEGNSMVKKVQVGWEYEGAEVISSTGYKKQIFVTVQCEVSITLFLRGTNSWSTDSDPEGKPDQILDIKAFNGSLWEYERNGTTAPKFQILQIETMNGKVLSTVFIEPKPRFEEMEVPEEEATVECEK